MNNVVKVELYKDQHIVSSKIISEQLGKEHSKVMQKIRDILTVAEYGEREYSYGNNNKATEYLLNKDSFILLVMNYEGFNDFKRAYIKRFNELEQQNKPSLPSYAEALRLYAGEIERNEALLIEQKENAPKVALANESIRDTTTHYSITNAGKQLGLKQAFMFALLKEKRLITTEKIPTQSAINRKMLTLRTNVVGGKNRPQAVMTMENIFNFKKVYEKDFNIGDIK